MELSEAKIKNAMNRNVMISNSQSLSLLKELKNQAIYLKDLIHQSEFINQIGTCYGFDYVITAVPIN